MRGGMNAHTGRKGSPERAVGRKCTASCRTPFHLPKLTEGISGKGQPLTSEGAQLAYPTGFQLDDAKVDAWGTKALPGKANRCIVFSTSTMRIFLETRPASRVFSSLHGYASPPSVRKRSISARIHTVQRGDKRLPLGRRPCDTHRQNVERAIPRYLAASAARIAPPLQFVVVLFGMKKAPCKPFEIYAELKLAGGAGHKEDMAGHFS